MTKKKNDNLDIERIVVDPRELVGADWNPNEMTEEEFEELCMGIRKSGFIDPPTVAEVRGEGGKKQLDIIGGHHRVAAAIAVGLDKIPADLLVDKKKWADEDLRKFQNVRLNVLHGKLNPEKFVGLYNEMVEKYGKEAVAKEMGYVKEDGIRKMVKQVAKGMQTSMNPEMSKQFQEQAKEARTVGDIERIIQQLMQEHGDSVKQNFVVFAWGGKEHVYIAMSRRTRDALKKVLRASRSNKVDVNEYIAEAIEAAAEKLTSKKNGKSKSKKKTSGTEDTASV
jgi:hypothetical protein